MALLLIATGLLGLAVGSFLNVVVHRVPRAMSLSRPGSHCPECGHSIRHRHNVPVLGWLVLRGRCTDCGVKISARYPLVELGTALLFVAVTARLVQLDLVTAVPAFLWFVAVGISLALIDLEVRRLPDAITLPAYPVLAALLIGAALLDRDVDALLRAGLGALASFGLYYLVAAVRPGGMGWGDVKTAGLIGGMLGYISWPVLLVGTAAAFALGATVGIGSILARRANRTSSVPFGPFMVAGALAAVFVGTPVADAYRQLLLNA